MPSHVRLRLIVLALLACALSACGPEPAQVNLCEGTAAAFFDGGGVFHVAERVHDAGSPDAVKVIVLPDGGRDPRRAGFVLCRFAGTGSSQDRFTVAALETDTLGRLDGVQMTLFDIWRAGREETRWAPGSWRIAPAVVITGDVGIAYFIQQVVTSLLIGSVYGLTAIGYTMVYAIIGVINFAYGEIYMIGAFQAMIAFIVLSTFGITSAPLALGLSLATTLALTSVPGWLSDRLVFRHMRRATRQSALIAAIGLSIALQEAVRLLQGSGNVWIPPIGTDSFLLFEENGFPVRITLLQLMIGAAALSAAVILGWFMTRSTAGRDIRAVSQDPGMAAMLGIDVDRAIGTTFAIGAAMAALAGTIDAFYYGGVGFHMGFRVGFEALTAALLGGIGSVPGAALGGLIIGTIETFWSAYLPIESRDMVVFGILVLVLMFRPAGLLGLADPFERLRP